MSNLGRGIKKGVFFYMKLFLFSKFFFFFNNCYYHNINSILILIFSLYNNDKY